MTRRMRIGGTHRNPGNTAKRDEKILALAEQGISHQTIGERFGLQRHAVANIVMQMRKKRESSKPPGDDQHAQD